jgi:anti-anti-sigma regulatory factor
MLRSRGDGFADAVPTATRVGEALIVTLPRELDDAALLALRTVVMERVRQSRTRALVFEASGLDVIDATEFRALAAVARTAAWLGVRPMLVGLSPGIVGYLVDAGVDTSDFIPFGSLDDALVAIGEARAGAPRDPEPAEGDDPGAGASGTRPTTTRASDEP